MYKQQAYVIAINFIVFFSNIGLAQTWGPCFLIIGAAKCGTTSLYNYLVKHPHISPAIKKEVHFFDINFSKGFEWYQTQLNCASKKDNLLIGEASACYLFHPLAPRRIAQSFPQVKLIILLRNPTQRAFSHYRHMVRRGIEKLNFEQAINSESQRLNGEREKMLANERYNSSNYRKHSYCTRGIYIDQIKHWMRYFPKEQFLIIKSEDLFAQPENILKQVHTFLGIPPCPLNNYPKHQYHPSPVPLDKEVRDQLTDFFRPYDKALEEFLDRKFDWDQE